MFFSFYKIIILKDEIEKSEKRGDDYINKKDVNFKKLCDFKEIFSKVYNLSSSLNESRFLKSSKRINDFDF